MEHYGGLKALCEDVVSEVFPSRSANVRAGLIVGPHDPTDRFTYWPTRVARGGEVLAPGRADRPVEFVDARDLGAWLVTLAEQRTAAPSTRRAPRSTFGELLESCRRVAGNGATLTWVDEPFLLDREVGQWMELPLWIAESDPEWAHMQEADVCARTRRGPHVPAARRDGARHARLGGVTRRSRPRARPAMGYAEGVGRVRRRKRSCSPSGTPARSIGRMDGYPFVHREHVRFRDLDAMGHINNAVFATYVEQARVEYLASLDVLDRPVYDPGAESMILARSRWTSALPARPSPTTVEIGVRPTRVGTKSFDSRVPHRAGRRAGRRGDHRARLLRLRARRVAARPRRVARRAAGARVSSTYHRETLPNGLRVLTAPMDHAQSVTCFVMVAAGSRYEPEEARRHRALRRAHVLQGHRAAADRARHRRRDRRDRRRVQRVHEQGVHGLLRQVRGRAPRHCARRARRHDPQLEVRRRRDRRARRA